MLKNVIFDFGAVLFEWNPNQIVKTFTPSDTVQHILLQQVLQHPDWISLDRGTMLIAVVTPIDLLMVKFTFYKRSNNLIVHLFAFRKTNGFSY
ncbi:hypothetical protein PDPUS_2_00703 [Photobacterium damselae subsp. piscicida]|uniref:HAD family phosphatase n=1 Tax=Photobacterium damsela subsp. piscicida TaxID=38294 RepID=A0AAD1CJF5_PHODP|nr:hypothetical protein [Photobacterium damselae]BAX55289.1 hypothetical protein PDPUS_2_00703 [Photobacterium damselae subsp. piscicida]GAW46321.1 hypothetical protein PDPJ_2_00571 [Photobacterium damselae subsp. piscicida]